MKSKRILLEEVWSLEEDGDAKDKDKPVGWWRWLRRSFGLKIDNATVGEKDLPQEQDGNETEKTTNPEPSSKPPDEIPRKDEPLATRIAHSVASMREDATPPPTSPTG